MDLKGGQNSNGATTGGALGEGLREGLEMNHVLHFPPRVPRVLCGYFAHERRECLGANVSHYGDPAGFEVVGASAEDCYAVRYEKDSGLRG